MLNQEVGIGQSDSLRPLTASALDEALAHLMSEPAYGPGARLPTERVLAERFNVSRGAIRAGLARIEARGEIVRIMGSGTYVAKPPVADLAAPVIADGRDASPQEIMEARMLLEPQMPVLVVAHANGADMERIRTAMVQAEAARNLDDFEVWDGRFHEAIAHATHNRLIITIYQTITSARNLTEWGELKRRNSTKERRAAREAEHRAIFQSLQSRDAAQAEAAMREHLRKVNHNLLGYKS
ncbi:MAG TPA: FCD domain-containing protein [Eoetvoesiella sp.]